MDPSSRVSAARALDLDCGALETREGTMATFEQRKALYTRLWETCEIRPDRKKAMMLAASTVAAGRMRYEEIAAATGVPWWFIGFLHLRESNCNFGKHLHNGDDLGGKTYRVPANRPPWKPRNGKRYTFEESAEDALAMKGFAAIKDWSVERVCFEAERYNGTGYRDKGDRSPYLWASTNHQIKGKYTRDRYFDPEHWDIQPGVCAVLKVLLEKDPTLLNVDPVEAEAIAAPKAGDKPETHQEAHALLKAEKPAYSLWNEIVRTLGLPLTIGGASATGASASGVFEAWVPAIGFFKDNGWKVALAVVVVTAALVIYQYRERQKVMT